jgi:hypothetical protein
MHAPSKALAFLLASVFLAAPDQFLRNGPVRNLRSDDHFAIKD